MNEIILYNYFRSSTSYRVRIALNLKNLEYQYQPVHLLKDGGEQYQQKYLALNPMAEVPTLHHEGFNLGQSMAIIEYLEDVFPSPHLFPKDLQSKGKVRQFCETINSFMHPLSNLKVMQYLEKNNSYTAKDKEQWISHWYHKGFQALENWLSQNHGIYSFGNQITYADCFLIPLIFSAQRFNVNLVDYKLCLKINDTCLQIDEFKKAHPYRQTDTPEAEKII